MEQVSQTVIMVLFFIGLTMLLLRVLSARSTPALTRQVIHQLFLQRLTTLFPGVQVVGFSDEALTVRFREQTCVFHFDQLYRRCQGAPSQCEPLIRQAVSTFAEAMADHQNMPEEWEQRVYPLLIPVDAPSPADLLTRPFTERLLIGYALNMGQAFRWVTRGMCDTALIDTDALHALAIRNLDRSCNMLVIETPDGVQEGHEYLLRFATGDGLDAARMLIPSFYQRFSPRFNDGDLLVAIPARDLLAISTPQERALINMLSWRSGHEYDHQPYPLTPTLLLVRESDITSWPLDAEASGNAGQRELSS